MIFSYVSKPHRSTPWRLPWHDSSKQDLMTGVWVAGVSWPTNSDRRRARAPGTKLGQTGVMRSPVFSEQDKKGRFLSTFQRVGSLPSFFPLCVLLRPAITKDSAILPRPPCVELLQSATSGYTCSIYHSKCPKSTHHSSSSPWRRPPTPLSLLSNP